MHEDWDDGSADKVFPMQARESQLDSQNLDEKDMFL